MEMVRRYSAGQDKANKGDGHALRAAFRKLLRDEHVNPLMPEWPINEKCRVWIFLGPAPQFDGLIPDDLYAVRGRLRFKKRFKLYGSSTIASSDSGKRSSLKGYRPSGSWKGISPINAAKPFRMRHAPVIDRQ